MNTTLIFENQLNLDSSGWAQLFPYGDFPGAAVRIDENGKPRTFEATQRLDRQAAENMVSRFNSIGNRVKRAFGYGAPIYLGHPDHQITLANDQDTAQKGMVVELQVRDDGLYCRPIFNNEGMKLLEGQTRLAFSGRWSAEPVTSASSVFRPDTLHSVGLTPRPNLPVHYVNSADQNQTNTMKPLLDWLMQHGVTLAADATPEQIAAACKAQLDPKLCAMTTMANEKSQAATDLAAAQSQLQAAQQAAKAADEAAASVRAAFANERAARIDEAVAAAVVAGRITQADAPAWKQRLSVETTFANELKALGEVTPKIKTASTLTTGASGTVDMANSAQRNATVLQLVAKRQKETGEDYDHAFVAVQRENPALFSAMHQPKI